MFSSLELPDTVSVFPLPGALLLPRSRLPLHIFEPRYLAMIEDALKTPERLIGMVQPLESPRSNGGDLQSIGCAGRITQFTETDDGRYLITLSGVSRFRVSREIDSFVPYRRCDISWAGFERDTGATEYDEGFDRSGFVDLLSRYFSALDLSTDWDSLQDAENELLINSLSMLLEFDAGDKQALLEAPSLSTRRETLITLIEFALRGGAEEDLIQ